MTTVGATTQTQSVHIVPESVSFKSFWQSKKNLRTASGLLGDFTCPLVLNVACANLGAVARLLPYASSKLSRLFRAWRAASSFASQERIIRQRTRERKAKQFDSMLEEAMAASKHGITGLHQLLQRWKPKSSKRSIHFRNADGSLMDQKAELLALKSYFSELYQSAEKTGCAWILQEALPISLEEVRNAFHALSARKALPPKQAPALLWKIASDVLVPCMHYQLQRIFSAGRITFPEAWHEAFLALLPKVGKAPTKATQACNLRPISLLPAAPKLVAKILADKLRPYLQQALQSTPQFAYQQDRQTGDALDRVLSHCLLVRSRLQDHRSSVFSRRDGSFCSSFTGGVQLSLDMSKAYDRLPRARLWEALCRVGAPESLITAIMYIHQEAWLTLERHGESASVEMACGVRQGCGLSPLLWLAFTLLIFDRVSSYVALDNCTGFADDFHFQWMLTSARDLRQI